MIRHPSVEHITRVRAIVEELLELPPGDRMARLATLSADNAALQAEVRALLDEVAAADSRFAHLESRVIRPTLESLHRDSGRLAEWMETSLSGVPPNADPLTGRTVGHFQILAPIGRGGMGIVYLARDTVLERQVALKFLPASLMTEQAAKERFIREAKAASALDHPNIATIHEIGETEDHQLFIAMGYYPGETLRQHIARGPLQAERAIEVALALAAALDAAHRHGIVHRDIKPGNVILGEGGSVKLLDFGLAKYAGALGHTQHGQLVGTLAYMSPEQLQGRPVDARTDIWSLGVLFYEMLAGCRPFGGEETGALLHAILNEPPAAAAIPGTLLPIIGKCLAKDPGERYADAGELLADLREIRAGMVPDRASGLRTWRGRRRRARLAAGLAAAALLSVSLIIGYRFLDEPAPPAAPSPPDPLDVIAVLPFKNLSGDPGQDYFVEAMQEGTITSLARIKSLKVISSVSTNQYRDTRKALPEIARELGAEAVIVGSVQLSGDRMRISTQLIDARNDITIWADSYDRTVSAASIFGIQGELAAAITRALQVALLPAEQARVAKLPTENMDALEALYQGRAFASVPTNESWRKAQLLFEKAIGLDPGFALAYVELAQLYKRQTNNPIFTGLGLTVEESRRRSRELVDQALALDNELAEAHWARGLELYQASDYVGARNAYQRAIALNPSYADGYASLGDLMMHQFRRSDLALALYEKAAVLRPDETGHRLAMIKPLRWERRIDEAKAILEREIARDPDNSQIYWHMGSLVWGTYRFDEILFWQRRAYAKNPYHYYAAEQIRTLYELLGDKEQELWWLERAAQLAPYKGSSEALNIIRDRLLGNEEAALQALIERKEWLDVVRILNGQGRFEEAMEICRREFPQCFAPLDLRDAGNAFKVVDDPFQQGRGRVLRVDPRGDKFRPYRNRTIQPYHLAAELGFDRQLLAPATLYFRLARPAVVGIPGIVDCYLGLAAGEAPEKERHLMRDGILAGIRLAPDGIVEIRDGRDFTDASRLPLDCDIYHEFWLVLDPAASSYDVYIRGGPAYPEPTCLRRGAAFAQPPAQPLDRLRLVNWSISGWDCAYLDDLRLFPGAAVPDASDPGWIQLDTFDGEGPTTWTGFLEPAVDGSSIQTLYQTSVAMAATGMSAQAGRLRDTIVEDITNLRSKFRGHWMVVASVQAQRGQREEALRHIRDSIAEGYFQRGLASDPAFASLKDDPEFIRLAGQMEAGLDAQLQHVRDMDARGEIDPVPDLPKPAG